MAQGPMIGTITAKVVKLSITIIILFLYRTGYRGQFLGVGAVWNFNEEKNSDVEILASGVFVGYLIYNLSVLITYCISSERSANDCLMNLIGIFLWVGVAGTALHYWHGFQNEHGNEYKSTEKDVGMAVGSLCVLNAAAHLIDGVITFKLFNDKLLSLIAFCLAQFSVSSSFAETWGCRFWTIELTMVGLTGYLVIWTCILTCFLLSSSPPPFLVLCFAITGLFMHLPNGITTLVDYMCGSQSISASDYCTYSPVTLAVGILTTMIGAIYGALTTFILCCRSDEPPEC